MAVRFDSTEEESIVAEINITPLTDIFLVLLIIFMISSSSMLESGLSVKLPSAKADAVRSSDSGKPTFITVGREGALLINETAVPETQFEAHLKNVLSASVNKTVVIRGDEGITLGKAVRIMDAARSAGAEKIALATQTPGS